MNAFLYGALSSLMLNALLITGVVCPARAVAQTSSSNASAFKTRSLDSLTVVERELVEGSKQAILKTGLSESYFEAHFELLRVESATADRRVSWQFSIDDYQAVVNDSIGYYTDGPNRVNTHSVTQALGQTSEIVKTIPRTRALKIMKACIGAFSAPAVEYGPVDGRAELLMVAYSRRAREIAEGREREGEDGPKSSRETEGADEIESEGDEKNLPKMILGFVNLQSGKCTKGTAVVAP